MAEAATVKRKARAAAPCLLILISDDLPALSILRPASGTKFKFPFLSSCELSPLGKSEKASIHTKVRAKLARRAGLALRMKNMGS